MNSRVILLIAFLALVDAGSATLSDDWAAFKSQHGKSYESRPVEAMRRAIFTRNKQLVDQFNAEKSEEAGYELGLNHFSDKTESELSKLKGFKLPQNHEALLENSPEAEQFLRNILNDNSIKVPDSFDWRKVPNRVTEVKNQGECGSCYAFASVGALEGQLAVRNSSLVSLSPQNVVDCINKDGCSGGWMKQVFDFVKSEGGIEDDSWYPYVAQDNTCYFNKDRSVITDSGAAVLKKGDEQMLKETVAKFGPVSVAINALGQFAFYKSGVFNREHCLPDVLDHAVLVVGYGTDPKEGDYWILKNSWTEEWGEQGYVRMARNKNNTCGVASVATIPIF